MRGRIFLEREVWWLGRCAWSQHLSQALNDWEKIRLAIKGAHLGVDGGDDSCRCVGIAASASLRTAKHEASAGQGIGRIDQGLAQHRLLQRAVEQGGKSSLLHPALVQRHEGCLIHARTGPARSACRTDERIGRHLHWPAQSSPNVVQVGAALVMEHPKFQVEITPAMTFAQCDLLGRQELDQGRHSSMMGGERFALRVLLGDEMFPGGILQQREQDGGLLVDHHEGIELLGAGVHPAPPVDGGQDVVDPGLQTVPRIANDPLQQRPGDPQRDGVHLGRVVRTAAAPRVGGHGHRRGREDVGDELEFRRADLAHPMEQRR
mmetsp:Transcript_32203/g.94779  ORF Transcript_32203/g.94779 Transcript_32203/m.94779 type:complete len:320 (+) Transcript_32203:1083-2042(+)